jgi:hypothetical protein
VWFGDIIILKKPALKLAYQPAIAKKSAQRNFEVKSDKEHRQNKFFFQSARVGS